MLPYLTFLCASLYPTQVRQDTWASFLLSSGVVGAPQGSGQGQGLEDEEDPVFASSSYNWVLNAMSLYFREVWLLVRGDCIQDPRAHPGTPSGEEKEMEGKVTPLSYSRGDLCEVNFLAPSSPCSMHPNLNSCLPSSTFLNINLLKFTYSFYLTVFPFTDTSSARSVLCFSYFTQFPPLFSSISSLLSRLSSLLFL